MENNPLWAMDPEGLQAATWNDVGQVALPSIGAACTVTGGTACAAAAVGAVGIGSYVLTDKFLNPYIQPSIGKAIDCCMESRARGERGATGGAAGTRTNNPYKHCRNHPTDPNKIICRNHQTGKAVEKKKPADWPKND